MVVPSWIILLFSSAVDIFCLCLNKDQFSLCLICPHWGPLSMQNMTTPTQPMKRQLPQYTQTWLRHPRESSIRGSEGGGGGALNYFECEIVCASWAIMLCWIFPAKVCPFRPLSTIPNDHQRPSLPEVFPLIMSIPLIITAHPSFRGCFQQDDMPCHNAQINSECFLDHDNEFAVFKRPPRSPDLNRAEHLRDVAGW